MMPWPKAKCVGECGECDEMVTQTMNDMQNIVIEFFTEVSALESYCTS